MFPFFSRGWFLVLLGVMAAAGSASAQRRIKPPASYVQPTPPSQQEGEEILDSMRHLGLGGAFYQEFELRIMPRADDDTYRSGVWYGTLDPGNNLVVRMEVMVVGDEPDVWIVRSGARPVVWQSVQGGEFVLVTGEAAQAPIAGSNVSALDLQTPFMAWTDFVYEGLERFLNRPTHVFLLYPPDRDEDQYPGIGAARVFVDTQFQALSQVQWVGLSGEPLKTISVTSLKRLRVGDEEQWILKSFDVRNDRTRDKTRFSVTAAALNVDLPDWLFSPGGTPGAAGVDIPSEKIVPVR